MNEYMKSVFNITIFWTITIDIIIISCNIRPSISTTCFSTEWFFLSFHSIVDLFIKIDNHILPSIQFYYLCSTPRRILNEYLWGIYKFNPNYVIGHAMQHSSIYHIAVTVTLLMCVFFYSSNFVEWKWLCMWYNSLNLPLFPAR